ncbi:MAG: carboxylating nicotinate-nucleotide diphosphorylase [Rhizobacter sp.]|nr:carboxylating nicotinate-nucleotide diphosphorylase [Chlorobiales bacterium]
MPVKTSSHHAQTESEAILLAMLEDIFTGDITTDATVPSGHRSTGIIRAKSDGVIAGVRVAKLIFASSKFKMQFKTFFQDGSSVRAGDVIAEVQGSTSVLLQCERTVLNFMQRMSGIATRTREFTEAVEGTQAKILDTRKTAPALRLFDKEAVKLGGGTNHRFGLYDLMLIKDNHVDAAGGISEAIAQGKAYRKKKNLKVRIEVEVRSLGELREAVAATPEIILIDNFSPAELRKAVATARSINPQILLEASGGVNLKTVRRIAETGVDFISVGELTHSVTAMDISMKIIPLVK